MSVILDHNLGDVWHRSGGAANGILDPHKLAWMPREHRIRAERLRQAKLLYQGKHRQYYLDEARSQHEFPPLRDQKKPYFRAYNLLTLVAEKMADLLFGEAVRIYSKDPATHKAIDQIAERSWLAATLSGQAVECCWAGDTYLEIRRVATDTVGEVFISGVAAEEVYPLGRPRPDHQYDRYVRYERTVVGEGHAARTLLLETHYTAGQVERQVWELMAGAGGVHKSHAKLPIDQWPHRQADGQPLAELEQTGLDRPSIVYIPNGKDAVSDYDGLIGPQDELHAAHTQIGRVIAKHSDPKMAAPASSADANGNLSAGAEVFFFNSKDEIPQYITWNAELAAAMEDRRFALSAFATEAEMPLSLLGVKDDSSVETAAKMRLSASPALAKAMRKALYWQSGIRLTMTLAIQAQTGSKPAGSIGVEMRDGLPDDEMERANVIATLRGAGSMSRRRALQQQWLDEPSVDAEMAELAEEESAQMPSVLLGSGGGLEAGESNTAEPAVTQDTGEMPVAQEPAGDQRVEVSEAAVLNGAQITAATGIVKSVAAGEMPRDAGMGQIEVLFNLDQTQAEKIMGSAGTSEPTTPNPRPNVTSGEAAGTSAGESGERTIDA